jgi:hypothetical protein
MHEGVSSVDYINSREMFFEMMLEANPKGYLIFVQCSQKLLSLWNPHNGDATG